MTALHSWLTKPYATDEREEQCVMPCYASGHKMYKYSSSCYVVLKFFLCYFRVFFTFSNQPDLWQGLNKHVFSLVWLAWPDDFNIRTWPRHSEDVPAYQNELSRSRLIVSWAYSATEYIAMPHLRVVRAMCDITVRNYYPVIIPILVSLLTSLHLGIVHRSTVAARAYCDISYNTRQVVFGDIAVPTSKINRLNMPSYIPNWIVSFLTGRSQVCRTPGGGLSAAGSITSSIVHGSGIGPTSASLWKVIFIHSHVLISCSNMLMTLICWSQKYWHPPLWWVFSYSTRG